MKSTKRLDDTVREFDRRLQKQHDRWRGLLAGHLITEMKKNPRLRGDAKELEKDLEDADYDAYEIPPGRTPFLSGRDYVKYLFGVRAVELCPAGGFDQSPGMDRVSSVNMSMVRFALGWLIYWDMHSVWDWFSNELFSDDETSPLKDCDVTTGLTRILGVLTTMENVTRLKPSDVMESEEWVHRASERAQILVPEFEEGQCTSCRVSAIRNGILLNLCLVLTVLPEEYYSRDLRLYSEMIISWFSGHRDDKDCRAPDSKSRVLKACYEYIVDPETGEAMVTGLNEAEFVNAAAKLSLPALESLVRSHMLWRNGWSIVFRSRDSIEKGIERAREDGNHDELESLERVLGGLDAEVAHALKGHGPDPSSPFGGAYKAHHEGCPSLQPRFLFQNIRDNVEGVHRLRRDILSAYNKVLGEGGGIMELGGSGGDLEQQLGKFMKFLKGLSGGPRDEDDEWWKDSDDPEEELDKF